ncbi:MAG: CBS domain-containing protein [Anaerolineaceae bacterium]|jgi:sporulation protein YlmC with PRC-barrel domain/CBS domain-containing protein|nr:CBS domain-containing protein [Anaerolineaceae bacterium]MDD4578983.1 CBS domain-containing protein [Anaerolineaceae bacterium]
MIYLSKLLNQKVWDVFGRVVGQLDDILIDNTEQNMPPIIAIVVKNTPRGTELIDAGSIVTLSPSITLITRSEEPMLYHPSGHELYLKQRVLDQQIVDTEGKRLVRVNDLQLARKDHKFHLTGVDVGGLGLLRRLGLDSLIRAIARLFKKKPKSNVIPWEDVASIEHDDPLRLKVSRERLVQMEPADIAAILDDLDHHTSKAFLEGFTDEQLADTLEESSVEIQQVVLTHLEPERAADILEEMQPDEAADILADMEHGKSEELLRLMDDDDEEDMRVLLRYHETSSGGIMTTEFAWVPDMLTVDEALHHLRTNEEALEDEFMYYVYILDPEKHLKGVLTLRDLVTSPLEKPLSDWFDDHTVTVSPYDSQNEAAYLVAKYNLMAVPVIDPQSNEMLGIVTVDDALDTVLPTAWKKKIPRFAGK